MSQLVQGFGRIALLPLPVTDLCHEYGISRPTACNWIKRYDEVGPEGLLDLARTPHSCPHATVFNHERPHEAFANKTPGSIYVPNTRLLPSKVASFVYPRSFQTRRVNNGGDISCHKGRVFVSEVLRNDEIGLEQMDEDVHRVLFPNTELGECNSEEMRFGPVTKIKHETHQTLSFSSWV